MQAAIGKVIAKTQVRSRGSTLISHFLRAAQEDQLTKMSEVFDIFISEAEKFARMIVSEFFVEESQKVIPKAAIGGIAGGSKFMAGYLFSAVLSN